MNLAYMTSPPKQVPSAKGPSHSWIQNPFFAFLRILLFNRTTCVTQGLFPGRVRDSFGATIERL